MNSPSVLDALEVAVRDMHPEVSSLAYPYSVALLRNHAADLIAVARAAHTFLDAPNIRQANIYRTQRVIAESELIEAVAPLLKESSE